MATWYYTTDWYYTIDILHLLNVLVIYIIYNKHVQKISHLTVTFVDPTG